MKEMIEINTLNDNMIYLAKQFIKRDNIDPDETVIGDVISTNPLAVSLFNNNAIFTEGKNLYVCENLKSITGTITIDGEDKNFITTKELNIGNKLMCVPTANGQKYIAVDRIL